MYIKADLENKISIPLTNQTSIQEEKGKRNEVNFLYCLSCRLKCVFGLIIFEEVTMGCYMHIWDFVDRKQFWQTSTVNSDPLAHEKNNYELHLMDWNFSLKRIKIVI